ncbi:MAG: hypothetical protein AB8B91_13165 [Rubripirellula sp.]
MKCSKGISRFIISACLMLLGFTFCSADEQVEPAIEKIAPGFCIIRPDEPASVEIFADYNGRRFYFCCESCRTDFLSDPSRFEGTDEPDIAPVSLEDLPANPYENSFWGRVGRVTLKLGKAGSWVSRTLHLHDRGSALLAAITAIWLGLLAWQFKPRKSGRRFSRVTACLISLLFVPCFWADSLRHRLSASQQAYESAEEQRSNLEELTTQYHDRDLIHYATFLNHGNPPIPRPSVLPASLEKTYYRGNDERSDEMPYGGNYRTVTFELWIEDAEQNRIQPGSSLLQDDGTEKELFFAAHFIRSPDTSSGYFGDEYMQRMYLTMQTGDFLGRDEPVSDRVQWKMIEENRTWIARVPLPKGVLLKQKATHGTTPTLKRLVDPDHPASRGGIVYLCEDRFWGDKMIGGRFHYAVQYEVNTEDGVVQSDSDLWMQATYRGRNFADLQITDEEWLSSEPIPER